MKNSSANQKCYNIVTKEIFSLAEYERNIAEYGIFKEENDFIINNKTQIDEQTYTNCSIPLVYNRSSSNRLLD